MPKNRLAESQVTNGGAATIEEHAPYVVEIGITGIADLLLHRWNCESVAAKSAAPKGSKSKKGDDIESYVYRNDDGELCVPGEYLRQAIRHAAKFAQDPRSPRKSAMDLVTASVHPLTLLASLGVIDWDYEDKRRVMVQRNGVTRVRPAMRAGWHATFRFQVILPEYVPASFLSRLVENAGQLVGIGDFRPTYGRFRIVKFEVVEYDR